MALHGLSQRSHQALLNALLGKTSNFGALASRPTIYVGLSSSKPTPAGTNVTEPSGGDYARIETEPADWAAASDADPSVSVNAEVLEFEVATETWLSGANITYAVFYDAATDGNFLGAALLSTPKPVLEGDVARIPAGDAAISLAATPDPD